MDFYAIELQIMEVDRLLAQSDLSADDRAAAILQKKYLVSEGVENDSFFSALKIQESLNNLTIQEQSDEDYARTLAREPQRDHGVINRQLRANIDAVNRAKVISGDTASALIDACRSALKSFAQTDDDYNSDDDNATQSGEKGDPSFSNSIFGDSAKGPTQVADVTFPAVLPGTTRAKCSVCLDVKGVVELQCKHNHCRKCLHKIFLNAVEDRSLMPVRCCRIPIDKKICSAVLNTREAEKYFSALEEVEAPNKMYW